MMPDFTGFRARGSPPQRWASRPPVKLCISDAEVKAACKRAGFRQVSAFRLAQARAAPNRGANSAASGRVAGLDLGDAGRAIGERHAFGGGRGNLQRSSAGVAAQRWPSPRRPAPTVTRRRCRF